MSRSLLARAVVSVGVLAAAAAVVLTSSPRLGLDLRGGTQIVLEAQDAPGRVADAAATDRAVEVLRRRVDALGVAEPSLTRSGERRIIVELPGLQDPREAAEVIGRTAQLSVHPILGVAGTAPQSPATDGETVLPDEQGQPLRLSPAALTGEDVSGASAGMNQYGTGWVVNVDFTGPGGESWKRITAEAACATPGDPARRIAIVLDREVISSPQVETSVVCGGGIAGGSTQITGTFSATEAKDLAALVQGGALPVPVQVIEQRTVGPTLGADAITASWRAALVGVTLTLLFLALVYRLFGVLATIGLSAYALISYAALVALGATLTLPGLAGFVLAIGMAVDANVLVFERAREEFAAGTRAGPRLRRAVGQGFRNAWTAIVDSNVTTLLAAGLLIFLASGPVRGFGITLSIGVLASMFSALVVSRVLVEHAAGRRWLQRRPGLSGIASPGRVRERLTRRNPQLMRRPRAWLAVSGVLVVLATTGIVARGLDFGVEFTGGRLIEYDAPAAIDVDRAREAVRDAGFPRAVVQASGDSGGVAVRTQDLDNAEEARIQDAIAGIAPGLQQQRDDLIGPSLGAELRTKALIALGVALAAQLLYLAIRFRWTYGTAAVLAMAHDVVVLIGAFAWLGKPIDGVFLAALLTVIGYSVNDTVVVFDRVRERRRDHPGEELPRAVNTAVLQTVPRTVNTGLGALFILTALAILGGDSLEDFALALIIGILVGTWSSSFTAAPAFIELDTRRPPAAPASHRPVRDRRPAAVTRPDDATGGEVDDADPYGHGSRPDSSGAVV
jgi:SecD/SecF fusion protein